MRRFISRLLAPLLVAAVVASWLPGAAQAQSPGSIEVSVSADTPSIREADIAVNFTITLNGAATATSLDIPFTVSGTATVSSFTFPPSPVPLPAGAQGTARTATIFVPVTEADADPSAEAALEGTETVIVTLGALPTVPGLTFRANPNSATMQVTDTPSNIALGGTDREVNEHETETVNIPIVVTGQRRRFATFAEFSITGSATPGTDYEVVTDTGSNPARTATCDADSCTGRIRIFAGQNSGEIQIRILSDNVGEDRETIVVALTGHSGGGTETTPLIFDRDTMRTIGITEPARSFNVNLNDADITEGNTVMFTVGISGDAPERDMPAMVTWTLSGEADAADYTAPGGGSSGDLTFTSDNWAAAQTVAVDIAQDNLNEGAETLTLTLNNATGGGGTGSGIDTRFASAVVTIAASNPITYSIITADQTRAEGDGTVTAVFTVQLSGASAGSAWDSITVPFMRGSGGSTTDPANDYTLSASPLTFTGTDFSEDITVTIAADEVNEADERLFLIIGSSSTGGTGGGALISGTDNRATLTITDDDDIAVSIERAAGTGPEVNEGATANFEVTLSHAADAAVTVGYRIAGDVTADADYTDAGSGTLTIAMGATTGAIAIPILGDSAAEGNETLRVELLASAHDAPGEIADGTPNSASVTIPANTAALHEVTVTGPAASVNEGGMAVFTFSLSTPAAGAQVRTADLTATFDLTGTAVAGTDYTAPSPLSVTFPSGNNADQTVSIAITDETLNEAAETLVLTLTGVTDGANDTSFPGGTSAVGSVTATIAQNDPLTYRLQSPPAVVNEGTDTMMRFFIELLSGASAADVTIPYVLLGTATAGEDYTSPPLREVTFSAGTTMVNVDFAIINDDLNEATEVVEFSRFPNVGDPAPERVGAAGGQIRQVGGGSVVGEIADDDPITVSLLPPPDVDPDTTGIQVFEAADAVFTVMLSGLSAGDMRVTIGVNTQGGASGDDFTRPPGFVIVRAGMMSAPLRVPIAYDGMTETGETLVGTITVVNPGSGAGTATIDTTMQQQTISLVDVDALRTLSVAATTATANEGSDLVFTFTVAGTPVNTEFNVGWSLDSTSSAVATDYSGPAMVTFTASAQGTQTQTLTLRAVDDMLNEDAETLVLTLTDPCAGMTVCSAGGRPSGVADTVPTLQLATATATATIAESDRPITLSLAAPGGALTEGTAASFAVSFPETITTTAPVEVDWAVSFPAASDSVVPAAAADFALNMRSGTAEIPAGARTANISITAAADMLNESAETFSIRLSNPRGGGAIAAPALSATSTAEASIAASDPVTVRIAGPGAAVSEGGTADFTLNLAPSGVTSVSDLCVQFSTAVSQQSSADGANTAANADIAVRDDCTGDTGAAVAVAADGSANGVFRFPAGPGSATLSIPVLFDNLDEGATPETLTVTLTGITPAAGAGMAGVAAAPGDSASAQLMNVNALRTLSLAATTASAAEGGGNLVFTATLNGAPVSEAFGVAWSLAGSAEGADYTGASSGTLSFGVSGERSQTRPLPFPVVDDALNEGAETLVLTLADPCTGDPCAVGGRPPGTAADVPSLQLTTATDTATIAASDPITVFITEEPSQTTLARGIGGVSQRTFVPGDSVTYRLSFGTTTVSGSVVQIVTTTHLTIPLILTNSASGATTSIPVSVQPGAQSVTEVVSSTMLADLAGTSGTPQISPSVGTVVVADASGNALSGPSAPVAQAGTAADLRSQPDSPDSLSPPDPAPGAPDSSVNPAPRRYTQWDMTVAPQESAAQAPEGASYTVTFSLRGNAADLSARGLAFTWQIAARAAAVGGEEADAEDFAFSTGAGCTESTTIAGACGSFPSGEVVFNAGDASQTLSIAIFDDGVPEGTTPEGFTLSFGTIAGANVGRATLAGEPAGSSSPAALQVDIPALRAFLGIEDAMGQEGGVARFALTLGDFSGGAATTEAVVVEYAVGATGDTADRGADYASAETGRIEIPAGEIAGQGSTAIEIPLLLDGRLEPRERFTVTITSVTGGGGSIDLADASAVGTIGDDADQAERRGERVGALVTLLDRQTAFLATDAISARFSRHQTAAPPAQLSIANRNLLAASKATAANGGSARGAGGSAEASAGAVQGAAPDIGLALYGAGGMGGAAATGGASLRGGGAGGYAGGGAGSEDAFGGLGAGLAGGANMGSRTALPNLAQLLRGSRFTFAAANWTSSLSNITDGLQFWGSGGFADIDGDPQSGGDGLSYDGDNFAFFAGADRPVGQNLLAGFALGWAAGDLDFTDRDGAFQMQGTLSNDTISVHPYLGWQVTPTLNAWLVLGFGFGSVDISENEGSGAGRISRALNGGDSTMLMFSAGFSEQRQFAAADLNLRFAVTRVRSDVDSARFDDGALLPSARGRSIRVGGEAELSRRFAFANGIALRPFGSLRARLDSTGSTDAAARREIEGAFDWGAGLQADWPALGLDGRFAFTRQLNETGRDEQRISATVNFDPGAKDRGLSVAVQSALAQSRNHTLGSAFGAGASANGAFGAGTSAFGSTFGAGAGSALGGAGATQSLSGEIAYGMAFRLRQIGRSGLLTPYARFHLGHANTRWAAGLRLAEPRSALQVGLEAALDRNSANSTTTTGSSYNLLLTGRLRF